MKVKSESEVPQSCPTLSNPMDCSLPGSSVHGIFQARVLEWGKEYCPGKEATHFQNTGYLGLYTSSDILWILRKLGFPLTFVLLT